MKICVALDLPTFEANINLAKELKKFNIWLKVGLRSYVRDGKKIIDELKSINPSFQIFLDLKLYDIPNTMADTAEVITSLDVDMFNIHASSGKKAMNEVMNRISDVKDRPLVLAVTALTSFSNDEFLDVYSKDIKVKVPAFAKDAYESRLDGVVCSTHESLDIKNSTNTDFITLCPGIRPFGEDKKDQQRVATLDIANACKVDFAVIGRPIYQSKNPKSTLQKIFDNLK